MEFLFWVFTQVDLFELHSMWGNFAFDFAVSSARGMSGRLISIWDLAAFVKEEDYVSRECYHCGRRVGVL